MKYAFCRSVPMMPIGSLRLVALNSRIERAVGIRDYATCPRKRGPQRKEELR
jgi:hypothetical protein